MSMTKKDFEIVARFCKRSRKIMEPHEWQKSMAFVCKSFALINPAFKIQTFLRASEADEKDIKQIVVMFNVMTIQGGSNE